MKTLEHLVDLKEPALVLINEWLSSARNDCVLLPPSADRSDVLLNTQVTTRSPLGAIAYETGGVLIDRGWLRFLGSGHVSLKRRLPDWNKDKADQCYFVADDAAGGFFAMNGGAFKGELGSIHYWPPDSLEWEPMEMGFSDFFRWSLIGDLGKFYASSRWTSWIQDVSALSGDQCFSFYPFLWTKQGSAEGSHRGVIPIEEAFSVKVDILRQLSAN